MNEYDDIIDHPRYRPKYHTPMTAASRAAQFSAFAALTGYDEEIEETARFTDSRRELTEDEKEQLNKVLYELSERPNENIPVKIIFFKPDSRKSGGAYIEYEGIYRYYNVENNSLVFGDGKEIYLRYIVKADLIDYYSV